ncbi:uncharacterized protein CPUR_06183 [Claviceps purpurea 20.1]|uniref:Aminoglycoside phosphotransferase domain-containing protein n=1 Tax=Claviceps purpurea (strain 20.1) TaxID=1111077 RepID=M1WDQ1_CLAP2|nr:hypothetical protein E4U36_001701 [Claviceps purpurea]KAG6195534.1 hypothetical protein E4U10_001797 [Claviceps purpurea]CCE32323.1 uncharacterized protein CPUR_06183 [Claviceps purpurea 20.1]
MPYLWSCSWDSCSLPAVQHDQLGALISKGSAAESQIQVGASTDFTTFRSGDGGMPLGPFRSSKEAYRAFVEASIQMIVSGEVGRAESALDIILAYKFGLDVVDRVSEETATDDKGGEQFFLKHADDKGDHILVNDDFSEQNVTADKGGEQFFLKHMDDKGDHILVNDDFDIVGIIDWECCQTAPREQAFSSPCMMWPVKAFYDGSNELTEEELLLARVFRERGREDLASCVLHGRKVQRLLFVLGPLVVDEDKPTLSSLFMGLKRAFDGHDCKSDGQGVEDEWEAWKAKALEDWKREALIETALEANGQLSAAHHAGAHIAV